MRRDGTPQPDHAAPQDLAAKVSDLTARIERLEAAEGARLLSLNETAARLGIHRTTLYDRVNRGEIPTMRVGKRQRVPASWVADTLAAAISDMQARADQTTAELQASA
jgi:excisionase family DNA binding protein